MMFCIKLHAIRRPTLFSIGYLVYSQSFLSFSVVAEKNKFILVIMAIALLGCLAPMPYGYYMLIRFAATVLFGIMAYEFFQDKQKGLYMICLILALLFQPIIKIALGRVIWNIVDVAVALFLVYLVLRKKRADS